MNLATLATTAVFVATPFSMLLGSSFFQYAKKASQGFPEPLGYAAFLGGLVLILGQLSGRDDGRGAPAFWGGLLMALAVFARPNLAISAAVILGAAAWWLLRRRQLGVLWALALGFLPILLVPAHNWIYGHQLVPLTAAAFHPTNFRAPPTMYLAALVELASLQLGGDNLWRAVVQLVGWLSGASRFPPMIPVHVAALVILVRVTARGGAYGFRLRTLGLATLGMHLVLVFWRSDGRYALLAWLLTLLVNLAWLQRGGLTEIDRRFPRATAYLRGLPGLARAKTGLAACERIIGPLYPRQTPADAGQPGRAGLS